MTDNSSESASWKRHAPVSNHRLRYFSIVLFPTTSAYKAYKALVSLMLSLWQLILIYFNLPELFYATIKGMLLWVWTTSTKAHMHTNLDLFPLWFRHETKNNYSQSNEDHAGLLLNSAMVLLDALMPLTLDSHH